MDRTWFHSGSRGLNNVRIAGSTQMFDKARFPPDTNSQNSRNGPFPQILGNRIQSNTELSGIMHRSDLDLFPGEDLQQLHSFLPN